jgi:predicted metal-dependent hydrolase
MPKQDSNTATWDGGQARNKLEPHYVSFFRCFNRGLYFEAHDELEQLWLSRRGSPDGAFYKGLIQLAGAFVHLEKHRTQPAARLLELALGNLGSYHSPHHWLNLVQAKALIGDWLDHLKQSSSGPYSARPAPSLHLEPGWEEPI